MVDLTRRTVATPQRRSQVQPGDVAKATKVELLRRADERRPVAGRRPSARSAPATATAAGGSWWPTATACSPTTTRSARCSSVGVVAVGDTGMQTGRQSDRPHHRLRAVRPLRRRGAGRPRPPIRPSPSSHARPAPSGAAAGRASARAAAACCSTRPAATASRPTTSPRTCRCSPDGSASRSPSPLVTLVDDGTMARRVGRLRHRRRGHARAAQRADRGRRAHRLHVGLPPGPQGGSARCRATAAARATSTCRWCG